MVRGCCGVQVHSELSETQARPLAERFAALADPTRLRLVDLLARHEGKVCVCELVEAFRLSQPTISHHLRVLRAAGLVDFEKQGIWAYYFVRQAELRGLRTQLSALFEGQPAAPRGAEIKAAAGSD